ncbi:MAG: hypothetical protein VYA30_00940 [Myxococcota bacterium]|nr:hypothetical protein [Myxococcota bacterium]
MKFFLALSLGLSLCGCVNDPPTLSTLPNSMDMNVELDARPDVHSLRIEDQSVVLDADIAGALMDAGPIQNGLDAALSDVLAVDAAVPDAMVDAEVSDAMVDADRVADSGYWSRSYPSVIFGATHNSYSGGTRGSLTEQLNVGIRMLELDVHVDGYDDFGDDWRIGHWRPGSEVADRLDGNPDTDRLRPWLQLIQDWSNSNRGHAPITLLIDLKDTLSDRRGPHQGNLGALNRALLDVFGHKLFKAMDMQAVGWPSIGELRDRIIIVLSGNRTDTQLYWRDVGQDPTLSINSLGRVVQIHASFQNELWFWTGFKRDDETIDWWHHGQYDTGQEPAVVVNDSGIIFDIHRTHRNSERVYGAIGHLNPDFTITWFAARHFIDGRNPSVELVGQDRVRVIVDRGDERELIEGHLSADRRSIVWGDAVITDSAHFDNSRSEGFESLVAPDRTAGINTLQYRFGLGTLKRVQYQQIMFAEYQRGDSNEFALNSDFAATNSDDNAGAFLLPLALAKATRIWSFDEARINDVFIPTFPATDDTFADWYNALMVRVGAIDWAPPQ